MRKFAGTSVVLLALAVSGVAAASGGPTARPEAGPGCFGNWRAGSVQAINEAGLGPAGKNYFAVRAGDNASINAANRATCDAL